MIFESIRKYLQDKKGATEEIPFGPQALVYKVIGRMFALLAWEEDPLKITLKCDPEHAQALRAMFPAVQPGYYMNKEHWNTITLDDSIRDEILFEMIDDSYDLVVKRLKKADRLQLESYL